MDFLFKPLGTQPELPRYTPRFPLSRERDPKARGEGKEQGQKGAGELPADFPVRNAPPVGAIAELHLRRAQGSARLWGRGLELNSLDTGRKKPGLFPVSQGPDRGEITGFHEGILLGIPLPHKSQNWREKPTKAISL